MHLPLAPLLAAPWGGGGPSLENSSRFGIYTIENPTFDTPRHTQGYKSKQGTLFLPLPLTPPLAAPRGI